MAKELSRDEFYFIDFVPAGFDYDQYSSAPDLVPVYMNNFVARKLGDNPEFSRLDMVRELGKAGGFLVGWGKRRTFMRLQTLVDCNAYQVQGLGFKDRQDATAFILAWS